MRELGLRSRRHFVQQTRYKVPNSLQKLTVGAIASSKGLKRTKFIRVESRIKSRTTSSHRWRRGRLSMLLLPGFIRDQRRRAWLARLTVPPRHNRRGYWRDRARLSEHRLLRGSVTSGERGFWNRGYTVPQIPLWKTSARPSRSLKPSANRIYNTKSTTRNWYAHLLRRRVELRGAELGARSPSSGALRGPVRERRRPARGNATERPERARPAPANVAARARSQRRRDAASAAFDRGTSATSEISVRYRRREKGGVAKFTFVERDSG